MDNQNVSASAEEVSQDQAKETVKGQRAAQRQADEKIQWHQGFYGLVEWDLRECKQDLAFETEHELSKKPLRVDLLIIKKNQDIEIPTSYARVFRKFNVIEYKSPEDGLTVDDFYKTVSYAMLYKGLGEMVNAIPAEELTVSLFRHRKPRELFRYLSQATGIQVEQRYPGVYAVSGFYIPVQIVVTKELAEEEQSTLHLLTYRADVEGTMRFLRDMEQPMDPGDRNNARAGLEVIAAANMKLFDQIRREANMQQVMRLVFGDEYDIDMERNWNEGWEQGRKERNQEYEAALADKDRSLADKDRSLEAQKRSLADKDRSLADKDRSLADKDRALAEMARELQALKQRYGLI